MAPIAGPYQTYPVEHFVYDGLGNVVAIVDDAQQPLQSNVYDAFGNLVYHGGTGTSDNTRFRNTKERSVVLGLDNDGFRYYNPDTGRYMTKDPLGFADGMNDYRSVHNSPVNKWDPLGLAARTINGYEVVESRGGHHKVPVNLWEDTGLQKEALAVLDSPEARVKEPQNTGTHNFLGHGPDTGYTGHTKELLHSELATYVAEHGKAGALTVDQQVEFAKGLITKIDTLPTSTYIGGFNNAVKTGGREGVAKWLRTAGRAMKQPTGAVKVMKVGTIAGELGTAIKTTGRVASKGFFHSIPFISGILGYFDARSEGATISQAAAVGIIDSASLVPAMDVKRGLDSVAESARNFASERAEEIERANYKAAGLNYDDYRR